MTYMHSNLRGNTTLRPGYTEEDVALIQSLADMIACSRAQAPRSKEYGTNELLYDARPEASTRVVKQLSRLALCLCYVLGEDHITQQIRVLLTKVALDTAFSGQHTIIRTVALAASGLTKQDIATLTLKSAETMSRRIDDLVSLGILVPDSTTRRTMPAFKCARWIQDAFRLVESHAQASLSHGESPVSSDTGAYSGQSRGPQKKRPVSSKVPNSTKR